MAVPRFWFVPCQASRLDRQLWPPMGAAIHAAAPRPHPVALVPVAAPMIG